MDNVTPNLPQVTPEGHLDFRSIPSQKYIIKQPEAGKSVLKVPEVETGAISVEKSKQEQEVVEDIPNESQTEIKPVSESAVVSSPLVTEVESVSKTLLPDDLNGIEKWYVHRWWSNAKNTPAPVAALQESILDKSKNE